MPGDVVSVARPTGAAAYSHTGEPRVIPADLLLLAGEAMTTEAMLTGESTPQRKHAVSQRNPTSKLARSVVYSQSHTRLQVPASTRPFCAVLHQSKKNESKKKKPRIIHLSEPEKAIEYFMYRVLYA